MGLARRAGWRASTPARVLYALLVTCSSLVGCSSAKVLGDFPIETCDFAEAAPSSQITPLSITSFWLSDPEENKALEVLRTALDPKRFDVSIDEAGRNNRVAAQQSLVAAFNSGRLPDVFQVNGGSDLLRWVTDRRADSANVCSLDVLAEANDWRGLYFPTALAPVTCHDELYGLPVGVHRVNNLFYNHVVFGALQDLASKQGKALTPPEELGSLEDLLRELDIVETLGYETQSGEPFLPLSVSLINQGPLTILAFENVLLSLGQRAYETLWQGDLENPKPGEEAQLRQTLDDMVERMRELVSHADVRTSASWQEAVQAVGKGNSLFTVNGDWGWAQLVDGTAESVRSTSFPGTADAFVYTPDSFAVPRELKKNGFAARAFLENVLANKDVLLAFSNLKHSIPPRTDVDGDWLETLASEDQRRNYQRFEVCSRGEPGCRLLLAVSGLAPPPGDTKCYDDIEPLLRHAVTGVPLADPDLNALCQDDVPMNPDDAKQKLIELLIATGKQRFAADCR